MSVHPAHLYYVSRQGTVEQEEYTKDVISTVKRWFLQITRIRNYQLNPVISNLFQKLTEAPSETETKDKFDLLCKKLAKKCKIDERITNLLYKVHNELSISETAHGATDTLCNELSGLGVRQNVEQFQKLLPKNSPFTKHIATALERTQAKERWNDLGLDQNLFDKDPRGASFLIKQRIAYSIVGFQETTAQGKANHQIQWSEEHNSLCIKVQGAYKPVSELMDLKYDANEVQLVNQITKAKWNYFSPNGLQPVDRYTGDLQHVEELSRREMKELQNHACKFMFPDKTQKDPSTHPCVLQVFTNPRKTLPIDSTLADRLETNIPLHAGLVLVKDGKVYSTGLGRVAEELELGESGLAVTVAGLPLTFDFETFRPHEGRIVTSIPLTNDTFDKIMNDLNDMRKKTIRYNKLKQNCITLTGHVLDKAGVEVPHKVDQYTLLSGILPAVKDIPVLGWITKKVKNITKSIENETGLPGVETTALHTWSVSRYLLTKFGYATNFVINSVIWALGNTVGSPIREETYTGGRFTKFSTLLPDFVSMFSHEPSMLHHSRPLMRWQLEQESTLVHAYNKKPSMSVLPRTNEEEIRAEAQMKKELQKKFNKGLFCTLTSENIHLAEGVKA